MTLLEIIRADYLRMLAEVGFDPDKVTAEVRNTADHIKASEYHAHHFGCISCCAAEQGRGDRCEIGMGLCTAYQNEESTL